MKWFVPLLVFAAGLMLAFHPMLFSGLTLMLADPGDTRFNHYVLEHTYRWLTQGQGQLWSPAFFFPAINVLAYSDTLLGVAPIYWSYRLLSVPPETAFQLWIFTISLLNYGSMFFFLKRFVSRHALPASLGAFLFAFGGPRIAQINHPQLLAQFYGVLAFYAICRLFQEPQAKRWIWILATSCVLQVYSGFYNGWFLGFTLSLAFCWCVILGATRRTLIKLLNTHWRHGSLAVLLSGLALWPLASHYLAAAAQVGFRDFSETRGQIPLLQSWFNMSTDSFLYGWLHKIKVFRIIPIEHEHRLGIGIATTLMVYLGLKRLSRHHPASQVVVATLITALALMTSVPYFGSLWSFFYHIIPAASAVRAVARIGLFLLFIYALGVGYCLEQMRRKNQWMKLVVFGVLLMLEQGMTTPTYNWREIRKQSDAVANQIPPGCKSFFYWPNPAAFEATGQKHWWHHLNAMWAQLENGTPTLNGYSGNSPPGWALYELNDPMIPERLKDWTASNGLSASDVCVIRSD